MPLGKAIPLERERQKGYSQKNFLFSVTSNLSKAQRYAQQPRSCHLSNQCSASWRSTQIWSLGMELIWKTTWT